MITYRLFTILLTLSLVNTGSSSYLRGLNTFERRHDSSKWANAREVLTLGLIWFNYLDATREGDGDRIITLWKFLLIIFRKTGHTNYSKEAAILLLQCNFLLSDRLATQVKYGRFVNTHGRKGCNMPCDLHMEHLNRRLKGMIHNMGSNIHPSCIASAAKALGVVHNVCSVFEQET